MAETLIDSVKSVIRVKTGDSNEEIKDLIEACKKQMELSGVYVKDDEDPLTRQAIKLYCKGHYGYDENTEKFLAAYVSLRDSMALSGEYTREDTSGSETQVEHS